MSTHPQDSTEESQTTSFQLTIKTDSIVEIDGEKIALRVTIQASRGKLQLVPRFTSIVSLPLSTFKDEEQARFWASQAFRSFRARSTEALLHEAALMITDEANWALADLKVEEVDTQELVQRHTRATRDRLRERFNIASSGQPSPWEKNELAEAVVNALGTLPLSERNYNRVSERLKETHKEKAPDTGEALRKLLSRFSLDWKKLKTGQYVISKTKESSA